MTNRVLLALACLLVLVRLPSLVEPMGADQGLYAYVGERILDGGLPYQDAWDQKPPAIHFTYAALRAVWPDDAVVAAADLAAATAVAALLYTLGASLGLRGAGWTSALLFLFLSNPAFVRLSGVTIRAQSEVFISLAVTGAFALLARPGGSARALVAAGTLLGIAFTYKYNAGVYAAAALACLALWRRWSLANAARLAAGFAIPVLVMLLVFAAGGALRDLYDATITYNVRYSGETYESAAHFVRYLISFPVQHARTDALWLLGGAACAVLLVACVGGRERLVPVIWVGASCLAIAINGSRGLPQYFVQGAPALAFAAGTAAAVLWNRRRVANLVACALVAIAVWRVNDFSKLANNTWHDTAFLLGRMTPAEHLGRYGDRETRKYSAIAIAELGDFLRASSRPDDHVFVFGFSCGAYVRADRVSASRFFWSRPIIVGFNDGWPGYGVSGLLEDLEQTRPEVVALQLLDWEDDVEHSASFFMSRVPLADWLRAGYERVDGPRGFEVWRALPR